MGRETNNARREPNKTWSPTTIRMDRRGDNTHLQEKEGRANARPADQSASRKSPTKYGHARSLRN